MADRPRLDSWKEIARYLGRDVSTVIRWERERGLPVYRLPGGKLPRVFAHPDELDTWLTARESNGPAAVEPADARSDAAGADDPPAVRIIERRRIAVMAGAILLLTGVVGWAVSRDDGPLSEVVVRRNDLVAVDESGRTRWRHQFQPSLNAHEAAIWTHIADLDGDRREDVIAAVDVTEPPLNQFKGKLLRFSADGELQWSSTVGDRLVFREGEYGPPWAPNQLRVFQAAGEVRIAWMVHHFTWWPGLLLTFNARGDRVGTFVNGGWIRMAQPSTDSQHVLVTGVTNSRRAYFFAVLDAQSPTGHSPEPPGGATECVKCPEGDPLHYVVFSRTDVGHAQPFPGDGPSVKTFEDGSVQIHVLENNGPLIATTVYDLSPDYRVVSARFSDSFWDWHRRLEQDGKITHTAAECPARAGLDVQSWTPATGWQTSKVAVR